MRLNYEAEERFLLGSAKSDVTLKNVQPTPAEAPGLNTNNSLPHGKPSHTRYWVVVFAVALAILSYIDRVAISQAAGPMSRDLGFTKTQMGLIFGAFALSYALFEVPSGLMGDRMGPRRVLTRIVLAWSCFTALTGAAWSFTSLWVIRFLFGAGEAGCFPNLTKALSVWLPDSERIRAQGILWAFARWGGAFAPPLVVLAFHYVTWRWAFCLFGLLGLFWCVPFYLWFRDRPADHPAVNAAERQLLSVASAHVTTHEPAPWRKLIGHRSLWLLWAQYFCFTFTWYFYITWLPTYLQEFRHQSPDASAKFAILPLLFGGFGALTGGFAATFLARFAGNVRAGRRTLAAVGMLATGLLLFAVPHIEATLPAMIVMGLASYANDLVMPVAWNACSDIGGRYVGTVAGSMNMMGNLAGFIAPVFAGRLLETTGGDWNLLVYTMGGVALCGALCWLFIDPITPIEPATRLVVDATIEP